jgi:cellulose synthase/poly-beta-1,6-N-acetylglucosamine synthase-like glycosyltransferase
MDITVIVPTYRRPKDLSRCLEALKKQTRPVDELLVTVRDTDTETWTFLETFNSETLPLRTVTVSASGAIAAMNAGLDAASGDMITFTDDDAAPHADWLARIEPHFLSDGSVGGVGGRDWVYHSTELVDGAKEVVGQVQWFGRVIGNHHLGVGEAREVDVLKGVNMSFRRAAIKSKYFDGRMQGTSAQIHHEIEFCLALKKEGWKLIYDPKIAVNHYTGQRFDEDKRNKFNPIAMNNIVHNETLALLEHLPSTRRIVFLIWAILVGTRGAPGFVRWLQFLPSQGNLATQKLQASLQGRKQGWQTWQESRFGKNA